MKNSGVVSRERAAWEICALACCIAINAAHAQTVTEVPRSRSYVAAGVFEENGQLHFERAPQPAVETLGNWHVMGSPVGELIGLGRRAGDGGTEVRVLNRAGTQVGTAAIPRGRVGVVTDRGVIALEEALHGPARSHDVLFYSLSGMLLRQASEPTLRIVKWSAAKNGSLVTVNDEPNTDRKTIVVYAPDGQPAWRYARGGSAYPDVLVTPDNQRLVIVEQDVWASTAQLTVLAPGNQVLQTQPLPNVYRLVASDSSDKIAAVGQHVAALLDARTGKLLWRQDKDIDLVLPGGLQFDPTGQRLLIVAANRDRSAGVSRLNLWTLDAADGAAQRAELGKGPLDEAPQVLGISTVPTGEQQIVLHDRLINVAPGALQAQ